MDIEMNSNNENENDFIDINGMGINEDEDEYEDEDDIKINSKENLILKFLWSIIMILFPKLNILIQMTIK